MTKAEVKAFAAALNTPSAELVRRGEDLVEARRLRELERVRARIDRAIQRASDDRGVEFKVVTYEELAARRLRHRERHAKPTDAEVMRAQLRRAELLSELAHLRERLKQINRALQQLP